MRLQIIFPLKKHFILVPLSLNSVVCSGCGPSAGGLLPSPAEIVSMLYVCGHIQG